MKTLLSAIIAALLALFGLHQSLAHTTAPTASPVAATYESGPASLAAAASSIDGAQTSSSTSLDETSAQTSVEKVSASANEVSLNSPVIERVFENAPVVQTGFVTQDELNTQLLQLSNELIARLARTSTTAVPQNVAADGNSEIPYAAENAINNLSNVTISNATISNSNVSGSGNGNDLPLSGGTITGDLAVDGNASTTDLSATTLSVTSTSTLAAIVLSTLNCSTYGNGGKLTTDNFGNVICAADQGGAGSTVAGGNNQVQFNGFGAFDASSAFTFATSTGTLTTPALSATNASTTLATLGTVWLPSITNAILSTNASGQVVATTTLGSDLLSVPANSLLAGNNSGQLVATTSIGTNLLTGTLGIGNGGTGISTTPSYGQLLLGNGSGGYSLVATSSLGISGGSGTVTSITAGSGLSGGTITTSGTISLNLANANDWTALQQFTNASSSLLSVFGHAYFGATATSSFNAAGQLSLVSNGLNVGSGQLIVSGGDVGIGTTTPGSLLSLNNIANLTTATSTFYSSGGINLSSGCFSINGTCISGGGGGGSGTVSSGTQGQFAFYNTSGTTVSGTSTISITQAGNIGIGTTTPSSLLSVGGNLNVQTNSASALNVENTAGTSSLQVSTLNSSSNLLEVGSSTGSIYLSVTAGGDVGIGTTSPTHTLSVWGAGANGFFDLSSTTSGDIFDVATNGNVGIGTTSPGSLLSINGVGNFVANATSTLYHGFNITSGCFSINGTCISGGGGGNSASSTLLSDNNTFSGIDSFTNASANFAGTWQSFSPSHFDTFGYLFPSNATSTTLTFNAGLLSLASSTIGNDTQAGGLTIAGGATTTLNAYFGGNVGIGTSTPGSLLSLNNIANFTTATSSFYSSGGINLSSGCFSINGTCISGSGGGGSGTVNSGTQGQFAFYNTSGTTVSGTSTMSISQSGNIGIGTTTPGSLLSLGGIANFTTATSTLYSSGGINLTSGCFSINGTCLTSGGGNSFGYLFPSNATSTTLTFNSGLLSLASTTVGGNLTVTGALNLSGGNTSYEIAGTPVLTASSTSGITLAGTGAGAALLATSTFNAGNTVFGYDALNNSTSSIQNTAIGYLALARVDDYAGSQNTSIGWEALLNDTTGPANDAIGQDALSGNTAGSDNDAMGVEALGQNTIGDSNDAIGFSSLSGNTTGSNNIAFGPGALHGSNGSQNSALGSTAVFNNVTGSDNSALGYRSLFEDNAATDTVAIGASAGYGTNGQYYDQGGTYVGNGAGLSLENNSNYNTLLGYGAGSNITTGANNIFLGADSSANPDFQGTGSNNTLTSGSNNISIGYDLTLASSTGNNQLDIQNILFGTGNSATGKNVSTGTIGIGTTTPYGRLSVWGTDTASSTLAFNVVNSASTTVFSVFDGGNAELSGSLSQSSDERLKTNIQTLGASSSLAAIDALNPVTFNWIDPNRGTEPQIGFIAQQVQQVFPNLVSTTSPTALTPDGTLSLDYIGLISPIVSAVQQLSADITSIENTIAGFAQSITTITLNSQRDNTQELCVGSTCVTPAEFQAMVATYNASQSSGSSDTSAPDTPSDDATDTPPQVQINGDNPAIVQVGATYEDLGATITGPQQDLNLGIQTFVNGIAVSPVQLDTSEAATDTIDYVVTDQNGLTSTSTRTVIVEPSQSSQSEQDTTSDTATSSSTTTNSTSTPATTTPQQQINTAASSTDATSTQQ